MLRTILITGASSGIGAATAIAFAKPNNRLILVSRKNREGLKKIEDEGRERGAEVLSILADVSDYESCKSLLTEANEHFGPIDLLINNAGISHIGLFQDMTPDEWQRVMNVNIGSVMNLCHLVIPSMVHRHHGRIINISSVWGNVGASCEAVYSASKGAINSFTKALAKELAPSNIQVNAIAFGAIETPMNAWLSKEEAEALADEIPAGREGTRLPHWSNSYNGWRMDLNYFTNSSIISSLNCCVYRSW